MRALIALLLLVAACSKHKPPQNWIDSSDITEEQISFVYTVDEGDTLDSIAIKYGTSVIILCYYNDITEDMLLHPGQSITLWVEHNECTDFDDGILLPSFERYIYTSGGGETLSDLAHSFGVTVNFLMLWNEYTENTTLIVGEQVIMPVRPGGCY